ncbi:hypothetical protein SAMN05216330_12415 [Bradyrhizobium sp. Ghvi]|nr:hypothetical protein SAMN05216330_12415 [Bradyrhizobium sp. Ghvi]
MNATIGAGLGMAEVMNDDSLQSHRADFTQARRRAVTKEPLGLSL